MGAMQNPVLLPASAAPNMTPQLVPSPPWQKRVLEIARELAGFPALVAVVGNLLTENQAIIGICAVVGLLVAIALRFFPRLTQRYKALGVLPWLLALILTLVLLLVVLPNRLREQNRLLASSWLDWQKTFERKASTCKKEKQVEDCLARDLSSTLSSRPKPISSPSAITQLASDVMAGQILLANETTRSVLSKRLGIDERFIGTGYSEPVGSVNPEEARVSAYLVPNLRESDMNIWVWRVRLSDKMKDGTALSETTVRKVLQEKDHNERRDHVKLMDNWTLIESHRAQGDPRPALIRFAQLDLDRLKPSGCLGRADATRVAMNGLGDVLEAQLGTAFKNSGHTMNARPDEPNVWLFIWVYMPIQEGIATRATWNNVLNNFTRWIVADKCLARQ